MMKGSGVSRSLSAYLFMRPWPDPRPWQAIHLAQRLRQQQVRVVEFAFSAASVGRLAVTLHGRSGTANWPSTTTNPHRRTGPRETRGSKPRQLSDRPLSDEHDDRVISLARRTTTPHISQTEDRHQETGQSHWADVRYLVDTLLQLVLVKGHSGRRLSLLTFADPRAGRNLRPEIYDEGTVEVVVFRSRCRGPDRSERVLAVQSAREVVQPRPRYGPGPSVDDQHALQFNSINPQVEGELAEIVF